MLLPAKGKNVRTQLAGSVPGVMFTVTLLSKSSLVVSPPVTTLTARMTPWSAFERATSVVILVAEQEPSNWSPFLLNRTVFAVFADASKRSGMPAALLPGGPCPPCPPCTPGEPVWPAKPRKPRGPRGPRGPRLEAACAFGPALAVAASPPAIVSIVIATRTAGAIRRSRNRRINNLRIGRRTLFLADLSWPCQAKSLLLLPSLLQFDIGSLLDPLRHRRAPASRNARSPTSRGTRTYPCYATTSAQRPRSTTSAKSSEGDRGRTSPCSPMSQAECARSDGLYFSPSVAAAMQETVSRVWESTTGICRTTVE